MSQSGKLRAGLRIRGDRGHPEMRAALIRFAHWLRSEYEFALRVPAYLSPREYLILRDGSRASASFFAPWERMVEPFIRIATGDYLKFKAKHGRDNGLAGYLGALAHEVVHYQQWIGSGEVWEEGVSRQASLMVRRYAQTVKRP